MPQPVKILMGLHPHPGWRSFKTSEDVTILDFPNNLVVYHRGNWRREQYEQYKILLEPFGRRLLHRLSEGIIGGRPPVSRLRYHKKQFEIFLDENGPTWDERLEEVLQDIALAHSNTAQYVLEVHDMSGGKTRWDIDPDAKELEEIDEREDSFAIS
jgi:hypothetical protein